MNYRGAAILTGVLLIMLISWGWFSTRDVVMGEYVIPVIPGWRRSFHSLLRGSTTTNHLNYRNIIQGVPVSIDFLYAVAPNWNHPFPSTIEELKRSYTAYIQFEDQQARKYPNAPQVRHLEPLPSQFHNKPALLTQEVKRMLGSTFTIKKMLIGDPKCRYESSLTINGDNISPEVQMEAGQAWNRMNASIRSQP